LIKNLKAESLRVTATKFVQIIDSVISTLEEERRLSSISGGKISDGLVELRVPDNLVIVGDLHGDVYSLFRILEEIRIENFLSNPNNKIIFLGDYVDRGGNSIAVLYSVCYLKDQYPDSIILMRGNHEAFFEFPFSSHDLPLRIIEQFGTKMGKEIYSKKIAKLFRLLSLMTIISSRLLIVHGGLPTRYSVITPDFRNVLVNTHDYVLRNKVLEEILWNDPRSRIFSGEDSEISTRGIGRYFGINISRKWLSVSKTKAIVRGHEPCFGYKLDHDDLVLTVFSCKEPYPKFRAGYLSVSKEQLSSIKNGLDLSKNVIVF
jgi:hypothetical protein